MQQQNQDFETPQVLTKRRVFCRLWLLFLNVMQFVSKTVLEMIRSKVQLWKLNYQLHSIISDLVAVSVSSVDLFDVSAFLVLLLLLPTCGKVSLYFDFQSSMKILYYRPKNSSTIHLEQT